MSTLSNQPLSPSPLITPQEDDTRTGNGHARGRTAVVSAAISLPQRAPELPVAICTALFRRDVADRKAHPLPQGFEWYSFQCVGPDILFKGAVVVGTISKGPRKGRKRYSREERQVVVTPAEELAEYVRFESETGRCGNCKGDGQVFARWHHLEGVSYRQCEKCAGLGMLASGVTSPAVESALGGR